MNCNNCPWKGNNLVCSQCKKSYPCPSFPPANMERASGNAPDEKDASEEVAAFSGCLVRIRFHSKRARLADPDGLSGKAVLDGIVSRKILGNDSAKEISSVEHTQEVSPVEETIVTIERI